MKSQKRSMTILFTLFMSLFLGSCGSSGDGSEPSGVLGESGGDSSDAGASEGTSSSGNGGTSPIGPVANPSLLARDESIVVNWDTLTSATSYDICQAEEVITDPLNCSVFSGGILHTNMSPPATINGLSNGKDYHFLITPYKEEKAGESTADLTATPNKPAVEQPGGVSGELNLNNGRELLDTVRADFASYASEQITIKAPDIAENGAVVPITPLLTGRVPG